MGLINIANAKNIYWFKKPVSAPLGCWFSVRVKFLVLESLTSTEAAVQKKTSISRKSNKDGNEIKIKIT